MDSAIVVAALILNPIARRKRAAGAGEAVQVVEGPIASASGPRDSSSPEKLDLELGDSPVANNNRA